MPKASNAKNNLRLKLDKESMDELSAIESQIMGPLDLDLDSAVVDEETEFDRELAQIEALVRESPVIDEGPVPLDELSEGELAQLESIVRETPPDEPTQLTEYDPGIHQEPIDPASVEQVHIQDTVEPRTVKNAWLEFTHGGPLPEKPRVQEEDEVTDGVIRRDGEIVGELPMEETITDPGFLAQGAIMAASIPAGGMLIPGALRTVGLTKAAEGTARFLIPVLTTSTRWELGSMLTGGALDLGRLGIQVTKGGLKKALQGASALQDAASSKRKILEGLERSLDELHINDTDPITGKELTRLSKTADELARATDDVPQRVEYPVEPRSQVLPPDDHFTPGAARLQDTLPEPFGRPRPISQHVPPGEDAMYHQLARELDEYPVDPIPERGLHDPDFPPEGTVRYGDDPLHNPEMPTEIGGEKVTLDSHGMAAHKEHAATTEYRPDLNSEEFIAWAKDRSKRAAATIERQIIDWEAQVKRKFRSFKGGDEIADSIVRSHGAEAEATRQFVDEGAIDFFKTLKKGDRRFLSEMMEAASKESHATRTLQHSRELRGELPTTPEVRLDFMDTLLKESSFSHALKGNPKLRARYEKMVAKYNEFIEAQVKQLAEEGMPLQFGATGDDFIDIRRMTPEEVLRQIDPIHEYRVGMKTHVLHESGAQPLSKAALRKLAADPEKLMHELYKRTQARIFRNRANQDMLSLYRNADEIMDPINAGHYRRLVFELDEGAPQLLGRDHMPGFTEITTWDNDKPVRMMMQEDMAELWLINDPIMNRETAHFISNWVSGTRWGKAMRTKVNPVWAVTRGLFKDISFTMLRYSGYRNHWTPFKGFYLLAKDMKAVAKDTWKHSGAFVDFFKEGGGQSSMYHSDATRGIAQKLAKLGDFTENWVRMAVRHRELINGKSGKAASLTARELLDFHQGGAAAKASENFFMYTNVMIQGTRGLTKSFLENPVYFAYMGVQVAAFRYAVEMGTEAFCEGFRANEYDRQNGINVPLGKYRDKDGQERWLYMKLATDEGQMVINTSFNEIFDSIRQRRMPEIWKLLGEPNHLISFDGGSFTMPYIQGINSLKNFSTFFMDSIYRGEPVAWGSEYDTKTPAFYEKAVGGIGLSPDRTEAAIESIVGNHFAYQFIEDFTSLLANGGALDKDGVDYLRGYFPQMLRSTPVNHTNLYDEHDDVIRKHNTLRKEERRSYNDSVKQYQHNPTTANRRKVMEEIRELPYEKRKGALKQFKDRIRTTKRVGSSESGYMGFVDSRHNEEQAEVFLVRYGRSSEEMRQKLEKHARRMGWFNDPEFVKRFYEAKKR